MGTARLCIVESELLRKLMPIDGVCSHESNQINAILLLQELYRCIKN